VTAEFEQFNAALAEVQSQLAFQEDTVQALNEAVASQQQEILVLQRQVELLKQQLEEQAAGSAPAAASSLDEKPPHY
jgi:SlyX protein